MPGQAGTVVRSRAPAHQGRADLEGGAGFTSVGRGTLLPRGDGAGTATGCAVLGTEKRVEPCATESRTKPQSRGTANSDDGIQIAGTCRNRRYAQGRNNAREPFGVTLGLFARGAKRRFPRACTRRCAELPDAPNLQFFQRDTLSLGASQNLTTSNAPSRRYPVMVAYHMTDLTKHDTP